MHVTYLFLGIIWFISGVANYESEVLQVVCFATAALIFVIGMAAREICVKIDGAN